MRRRNNKKRNVIKIGKEDKIYVKKVKENIGREVQIIKYNVEKMRKI